MTDQTSTPAPPQAPRPESNRFFTWLRSLGIVRADGWVGGVCGGIAIRTGLDPLIVRGIAVVVAVLGGPALFFYAVGWLLLPDTHGEIHLERMLRGVFDAPLVAIAVLIVATFFPFTRGVWWFGDHLANSAWWIAGPATALQVIWNLAVVAAIVWFIVWAVMRLHRASEHGEWPFAGQGPSARQRRQAAAGTAAGASGAGGATAAADSRSGGTAAQPRTASEAGAAVAPGSTTPLGTPTGSVAPAEPAATSGSTTEVPPDVPAAPSAGASKDDLAAWREQYAAWREQHAVWQEQQRVQARFARDARSAEVRAQAQALTAQAEQRRLARRAANPRAAAWFVALAMGVALVAGGIAGAAAAADSDLNRYAAPIGLAVALLAIGLAMVVAGATRRRSGFLAFLAIVVLVVGVGSFGWPAHNAAVGYSQLRADHDLDFGQFAGQVELDASRADVAPGTTREVRIDQSFGAVAVYLGDGVDARVEVTSTDSSILPAVRSADGAMERQDQIRLSSGNGTEKATRSWSTPDASGTPDLVVDITQGHGAVYVYQGGARPTSGNCVGICD
ncbi:MAG TPA: PspC domain-containing protein [Gryllotalpicola sp.]